LSTKGKDIITNEEVGSLAFFAPETHKQARYSHLTDMYAVGLIFYEMLFGDIPFTDLDQKNLYE